VKWPRSLLSRARSRWRDASQALLDLLMPARCAFCEAELVEGVRPLFCHGCREALTSDQVTRCRRCGAKCSHTQDSDAGCALCRASQLRFQRVHALGNYDGLLRDAVLRMKHRQHEPLSFAMAELLWEELGQQLQAARPDVIVPVPMHWTRRLRRGTNSPELVAAVLARQLHIPIVLGSLARGRNTQPQGNLTPPQRRENVRGAFHLRRTTDFRGARILLVDDILTTGATCSEAARVFLAAPAATVEVVVLARAQGSA
jgi:ComF family protein